MELGLPPTIQSPTISVPYTPSAAARCVNGLWFAALALSLAAAMIAMLAKEWLAEFTSSKLRTPHEYALLRQARFENFTRWKALHIIDLLPTLLHASLLLFSIGVVVYLWRLDKGVAMFIAAVASVTTLFYSSTTVLGAFSESCPFVTQVSKYLRSLLRTHFQWFASRLLRHDLARNIHNPDSETTTIKELRALLWLADSARDPAIGDCSYQALAGLRESLNVDTPAVVQPTGSTQAVPEAPTPTTHPHNPKNSEPHMLNETDQQTELASIFATLCERLSGAPTQNAKELAICQGTNVARYAAALAKIVCRVDSAFRRAQSNKAITAGGKDSHASNEPPQARPITVAFEALARIWDNDCPAFSPDSYANLTSAELNLTQAAVSLDHGQHPISRPPGATKKVEESPDDHHVIETSIRSAGKPDIPGIPLASLRARYSRALARASFLLLYHNNGRAPISFHPLTNLLQSISSTARIKVLNPASCLSTHQGETKDVTAFFVNVIGVKSGHYLPNYMFGDWEGILGQLLELVSSAVPGNAGS
ncbi:hypothetical protein FRC10_001030 [Ceratobasidium sp. 414]|nr:hypothetical protein FRC10_001030 [Ceratobasidium sp. 414]